MVQAAAAAQGDLMFVTLHIGGEVFAVPLDVVREIIRYPDVVHAPLGPASLDGLGNLRGTVLPILSLRRMLGCADVAYDDATRVVVLDVDGQLLGLVVDRVANVITAAADRIEPADAIRSASTGNALSGVIKGPGRALVMIVDAGSLVRREFAAVAASRKLAPSAAAAERRAERETAAGEESPETQLVSFTVADQEYALAIEEVAEIVTLPPAVASVPQSGPHLLGVMTLRDRLLPLVSLRRMFGLPDAQSDAGNKIVVVNPAPGLAVGIVMDGVREVLRVRRSMIDAVPQVFGRLRRSSEIAAICRVPGGNRLVTILSARRLFDAEELEGLAGRMQVAPCAPLATRDDSAAEEQFVVFTLADEEYAVPIGAVQEIVRVPDELIVVPRTPDFVQGVINLRGAVLPVVDQHRRFGLPAAPHTERQRIVVFSIDGTATGLLVDGVSRVMRVAPEAIGPAPELSGDKHALIHRVVNLTEEKRVLLVIEVDRLLDFGELSECAGAAAA